MAGAYLFIEAVDFTSVVKEYFGSDAVVCFSCWMSTPRMRPTT